MITRGAWWRTGIGPLALMWLVPATSCAPSQDDVAFVATIREPDDASTLIPESGTLLGACVPEENPNKFKELEDLVGTKFRIRMRYSPWGEDFPETKLKDMFEQGVIPMVSWTAYDVALTDIVSGAKDDYIRQRADGSRDLKNAFFLRWGENMNGDWTTWGGAYNLDYGGAALWREAFKRIRRLFREEGATNVAFVWCPNAEDVPDEPWNHWTEYYPGDDYVDWVGIDGYNFGTDDLKHSSRWRPLSEIMNGIYSDYVGKKPIMIAETGSTENGGDKAFWIRGMRQALKTNLSGIRAVLWKDDTDVSSGARWYIDTSQASIDAFRDLADDPWFSPPPNSRTD